MSNWTAGYVAEIDYTYGYYNELNPLRLRLAFLNAGLAFPAVGCACELGFGQGLSINIHAAASVVQWHGTDFNPAQAGFAQVLAGMSGADTHLFDQSFSEFCTRPDLPDFDFIGLHGIWSWISDENRAVIVDFVRRKLKVGGVLFISYNTQPGWAAMVPMRGLLSQHAETMAAAGQAITGRIDEALNFAKRLMATQPLYARANPQIAERLEKMCEQSRNYLAHEYFNRDWHPMNFSQMVDWLAPAKLSYACSAHYLDQIAALNATPEQQALLAEITDPVFRESVRDFMVNQQFRRDYWVKGARKLNALERNETLRQQRVMLAQPRSEVSLKAKGALGEATMQAPVYDPILNLLVDHAPQTLGDIERAVGAGAALSFDQLVQAVVVLCGTGALLPVQEDDIVARARPAADRLNAHLCAKSRGDSEIAYLASPVSGSGVMVSPVQQLFLLARREGQVQAAEWAAFAWACIKAQGQKLRKEGKIIEDEAENLAELDTEARRFAENALPILQALGIA